MLTQNFMARIQEGIKANNAKRAENAKESNVLEESADIQKEVEKAKKEAILENAYNPGFMAAIHEQAQKAKTKEVSRTSLVTESFSLNKVQKKLSRDITYFTYLFENFVDPELRTHYKTLLESILDDTIKLYQECDVTPRVFTPALNSEELTENMIIDLYKNGFNKAIKDNYTKPMLSGKIGELHESSFANLVRKVVEEGAELDMDSIQVYLPFEEAMYQFNRSILIPNTAESRFQMFFESESGDYKDLFEESAEDILHELEKKIKLLTALVAPKTFDAVVDSDVDGSKMAGVSIISDENFQEPCSDPEICPGQLDGDAAEEYAAEDEADDFDDELDLDADITPDEADEINGEEEVLAAIDAEDASEGEDTESDDDGGEDDEGVEDTDDTIDDDLVSSSGLDDGEPHAEVPTDLDREELAPAEAGNGDIELPGESDGDDIETGAINTDLDDTVEEPETEDLESKEDVSEEDEEEDSEHEATETPEEEKAEEDEEDEDEEDEEDK